MSQQQQQQQELLDEERSWQQPLAVQQQQAGSCGSLTAIGSQSHKTGRNLQESIGGNDCWTNDAASTSSSSSGWRHLTSSPSRRPQQEQQQAGSSRRPSPHCWSSESLLKDHPSSRWTSESLSAHPAIESDREPFIPPPPLLDFETANLLPPLGIDVSSPSDDMHFLPVPGHHHPDHESAGDGVNWVQIPPQYATLRRPAGRNSADGYSSTARRPRSNNSHAASSSTTWMDSDHESSVSSSGCHRTVGADGISRKCTCGQKMRLQQQQVQQQQQNSYSDGHIRSEDGLAGIATLRRPVKRKVRSQLPGVQQQVSANNASGGGQTVTAAAAAAILQQPKLETSVLLDKLLRAGALRPEDYLVLSRMERMIMANHVAGGGSSLNQQQSSNGARVRQPKVLASNNQQQPIPPSPSETTGSDIRREFDFSSVKHPSAGLPVSGQQSSENLYDSSSSVQSSSIVVTQQQQHYQRRLSAGNNSGSDNVPLRIARPSPGPSPFDYYNNTMGNYPTAVAGRGSSLSSNSVVESSSNSLLQQPRANDTSAIYPVNGPYPSSSRCCPCCGSPSHPQQQQHHHHHHHHHHHTCSLCGGGPHLSAGTTAATAAVASSSSGYNSGYSSAAAAAASSSVKMIQQPTGSGLYGYAPTARHFSAGDQFGGSTAGLSKYPAIGSSSSITGLPQAQQPVGKVPSHPSQQQQQPTGVRTELHSLPSNEPIR